VEKEQIINLVARTVALKSIAKDIHYQALLEQRWDTHKQLDEIVSGIDGWFDSLQEVVMVPLYNTFAKSSEYLKKSVEYCFDFSNVEDGKKKLIEFLADYLDLLTEINKEADLGTQNLVAGFAQSIQQYIGWLNLINKG
jgi:DNA-binding ferritin-like protein